MGRTRSIVEDARRFARIRSRVDVPSWVDADSLEVYNSYESAENAPSFKMPVALRASVLVLMFHLGRMHIHCKFTTYLSETKNRTFLLSGSGTLDSP